MYTQFQDEVLDIRSEAIIDMPKMIGVQYEKKVRDQLNSHRDHLVIHRLRTHQPFTSASLRGHEKTLAEIGEEEGETLLTTVGKYNDASSRAWFVKSMVCMDRAAAQAAFAYFLNDRSLIGQQMRFVEMVIDQLIAWGVIKVSALCEAPYSQLYSDGSDELLYADGSDELFAGTESGVNNLFATLWKLHSGLSSAARQ